MKDEQTYLSREKYEELTQELEQLTHVKRKEVAEHLEYAKALGDLSENAEYHEARDEQAAVEDRIARIEYILKHAQIIQSSHSDTVTIGSTVVVSKEGEKEKREFRIVSAEESDPSQGKISVKSPFGQAVLGKKKGEQFSFTTPSGKMSYVIVSLS